MNPYAMLADYCTWSKAVALAAPGRLDPMTTHHRIELDHKVATMGSCFAQHLARHLPSLGLHHYVAELPPSGMNEQQANAESYRVFSARYGNVYTVRQALQLFDRAFGDFVPADDVWKYEDGYVDAFRPVISPHPLASVQEVRQSAKNHLEQVRRVFLDSDWLTFTLGLTEAWLSKTDGAVYPLAPGVHGGDFAEDSYAFANFSVEQVATDLRALITKASKVNDRLKVILTVSPVPLVATYERRHVLVSTVCSKAVLRVAADIMEREFKNVVYFPAYEIIMTPQTHRSYFEDDLREVSARGVRHVMRVFSRHFVEKPAAGSDRRDEVVESPASSCSSDIMCDEEEIERAIEKSGARRG